MIKVLPVILLFLLMVPPILAKNIVGEPINIAGVENPVSFTISPDGLRMIIVDKLKKGQTVFKQAQRPYIASTWSSADPFLPVNKWLKPEIIVDAPCFSHDGEYLYFSANLPDTQGGMDIYYCKYSDGKWSDPANIGGPINSSANENNPSISGNNRCFYFTRDTLLKKLDDFHTGHTWSSDIDSSGNFWLKPHKLDQIINTGGIAYPKIANDNKTFFFSRVSDSKYRWQLYWVKKLSSIHWYLPIAIDTLNTDESEICPVFCLNEGSLYYIINTGKDDKPDCTIYHYKIDNSLFPEKTINVTGKVTNRLKDSPIKANILAIDPILGDIQFLTHSNEKDGLFKMTINAGNEFMLHAWDQGYSHNYQLYHSSDTKTNITHNIPLFDEITLTLNIYDSEELWPLNGTIALEEIGGLPLENKASPLAIGKQQMKLPIGTNYRINVAAKNYYPNTLEMPLTNIILFDKLVRDIELAPVKRTIKINVSDEETGNPLLANIDIIQRNHKRKIKPDPVPFESGHYSVSLRQGEFFDINVRPPQGFAFLHTELDLDADSTIDHLDLKLKPLKKKVPIRLNNINFEYNSADLLESSFDELNRVVQLVIDNPGIKLEIMAHTDDSGTDQYNLLLSGKRAQSVVDYMIQNKIPSNRLISKGFGESMPLVPNTTDENKALNRRVEMKILDINDNVIDEIEKPNDK